MYKTLSRYMKRCPTRRERYQAAEEQLMALQKAVGKLARTRLHSGDLVMGTIGRKISGGYTVRLDDLERLMGPTIIAFCPISEMYPYPITEAELAILQRKAHKYQVVEITDEQIVVSRKPVEAKQAWSRALVAYNKKRAIAVTVKTVKSNGASVDLGGITCWLPFLHRPSALKVGQRLKVWVVDMDQRTFWHRRRRIALSLNSSEETLVPKRRVFQP